jgi:serine phosphatase RsbU (regulator of sigma subunit)
MARMEKAQRETIMILLGLAHTYYIMEEYNLAVNHYKQAQELAEEVGLNQELSECYGGLSTCYSVLGDYQKAFEYLSLQNEIDNTLYRIEAENKTNNLMFSYQLEKKDVEIEVLEQEAEIEQLKNRRQRAISLAAGGLGFLLLLLVLGILHRMRFIRSTNRQIRAQKDEIESQRDKITDSIAYAERIQLALLPSREKREALMPEHFILYKPKDVVSGDFYWIREVQEHLVMVTADCTGHGVPGAFMSMLGISVLNDLIGEKCYNAPGFVLDQMRSKIKELLDQEGRLDEQKDGMDMGLAILDKRSRELHYSGANNPLYLIRKKNGEEDPLKDHLAMEEESFQLFEIKGDKQPIAAFWEEKPFSTRSLHLQEQDSFYMFTDGYVDQFGGDQRRKFKSVNLKRLLLSIQDRSMAEQERILNERFEQWKGNHEQIDDINVMGVRV